MLRMSSQIETIVNAYKTLAKIPSVVGGRLNKNGNKVTAKWSIRNLDKGRMTKYVHDYILDISKDDITVIAESDFGLDVSNEILSSVSPSETYRAVVREEKEGKENKKQFLEVWSKKSLVHSIDLNALDIHGDVYADSELGGLEWSPDETSLVYVAEKKLKKSEPYIKRKAEEKIDTKTPESDLPKKGEEFVYRQDWGEQLVGRHLSVIVVCRLQSESLTVLQGLPESWCPGQVRFTPDGGSIVGVALETEPRRLGLIFCTNRPGYIFQLTLDGVLTKISGEGMSVRSPRFNAAGRLVWLQRKADGPHHACQELVSYQQDTKTLTTLIPIVERQQSIEGGESFYGLYCQSLPSASFSSDGDRLVFSTPQQNELRTYVLDLETLSITDVSNKSQPGSTAVLDVKGDVVLAVCSNMTTPSQVYIAKLPARGAIVKWFRISSPADVAEVLANSTVQYLHLEHEDSQDSVKSFTALYLAPRAEGGKKLPLVVWPHGGPHSGFVNGFSLEAAMYNMLGFASLQINYRGSTGSGDSALRYLPSRVGDADVRDCKLATDEAIRRYPIDPRSVCLSGGSHGGFLVAHLSGQYPDAYCAVVTRNPVIDVASMFGSTDIPDCGDESVRCLIGNVGRYDVADCRLALTAASERDGCEAYCLYGGSYGGFTVAHLAATCPDMFCAMVLRNPLIDLATKGEYADNSDGCSAEAGFEYIESGPASEEQLLAMRRCSPLAHAHRVRAPTALLLGSGDKRVPCFQGLQYCRRLKANGVPTRIYMYDDNHSLSSLPTEMDHFINGADWLLTHLRS